MAIISKKEANAIADSLEEYLHIISTSNRMRYKVKDAQVLRMLIVSISSKIHNA